MRNIFLACEALETELEAAKEKYNCDFETIYFDSGLHVHPEKLRAELEKQLNEIKEADTVFLIMGLCGNSLEGITAPFKIVVPKVDDCITMLLTQTDTPCVNLKTSGHMYMTKGMVEMMDDGNGELGMTYEQMVERMGEKKANRAYRMIYEGYDYFTMVDDGTYPLENIAEISKKHAALADCELITVKGSNLILEKLCQGKIDEQFLTFEAGYTIKAADFMSL